jgi:hypothetical protein
MEGGKPMESLFAAATLPMLAPLFGKPSIIDWLILLVSGPQGWLLAAIAVVALLYWRWRGEDNRG